MPYTSLRDSAQAELATRRRHILVFSALAISLVSFVAQTIAASRLSLTGYKNAIFMLYMTHSSWSLLGPIQILVLWAVKWQPWSQFYEKHSRHLWTTARLIVNEAGYTKSIYSYYLRVILFLTIFLNVAGASWYLAVNWTSPSALTAIYNCSTFHAYTFSVFLLNEPFSAIKFLAVILSIIGVFAIASSSSSSNDTTEYPHPRLGNIVIFIGSVLYGLYEVLYKRFACPPQSVSSKKQAAFANVIASMIGLTTFFLLWPVLVFLHVFGYETFRLPVGEQAYLAAISVGSNMLFSGSFLVLISLTSPVLGSVAAMLTTFLVPLADWLLFGVTLSVGTVIGGLIVVIAFLVLSWASWLEMQEDGDDDSVLNFGGIHE